jgi:hypothetical protein
VKVAVVAPAATVTEPGTVAAAELLERTTDAPPLGAAALKATVPVDEAPLATLAGLRETEDRTTLAGDVMVSAAVLVTPR